MSAGRRRAASALVLVVVAGLIAFEIATAGGGESFPKAPPLPPTPLQGPRVDLATLRGHPALVNFWASWCEPCREEAPALAAFDRHLPRSAALVGVNYTDEASAARAFIRRYRWSFPVLSDPDGIYGSRYGFSGLPDTVAIDSRGRIVETLRGPQSASALRAALREAARH